MVHRPQTHKTRKHQRALHSASAGYNEACNLTLLFLPSLHNEGPNSLFPRICSQAVPWVLGMAQFLPPLSSSTAAPRLHGWSGKASACALCANQQMSHQLGSTRSHVLPLDTDLPLLATQDTHPHEAHLLRTLDPPLLDNSCMLNQVLKLLLENLRHILPSVHCLPQVFCQIERHRHRTAVHIRDCLSGPCFVTWQWKTVTFARISVTLLLACAG